MKRFVKIFASLVLVSSSGVQTFASSVVIYVDGGSESNIFYEKDDGKRAMVFARKLPGGTVVSTTKRDDFPPGVSLNTGESYADAYERTVKRMTFRYVGAGSASNANPMAGVTEETGSVKAFPFRHGVFVLSMDTLPAFRGYLYAPEIKKLLVFNPVLSLEPKPGGTYDTETVNVYLRFLSALSPRSFGFYYDGDATAEGKYENRLAETKEWIEANVPEKERKSFFFGKLKLAESVIRTAKKVWEAYDAAKESFPKAYVNPFSFDNSAKEITGTGTPLDPYMKMESGVVMVAEKSKNGVGPRLETETVSYKKATLEDLREKIALDNKKKISERVSSAILDKLNQNAPDSYFVPGVEDIQVVAVTGFAYPKVNALYEGNESSATNMVQKAEELLKGVQYVENVTIAQWKPGRPFKKVVSATGFRGFERKMEPKPAKVEKVTVNGGSSGSSGGGESPVPDVPSSQQLPAVQKPQYDRIVFYANVEATDSFFAFPVQIKNEINGDFGGNFDGENEVLLYEADENWNPTGFIGEANLTDEEADVIAKSLSWMSKKTGDSPEDSGYSVFPRDVKRVYDVVLSESGVTLSDDGKMLGRVYASYLFDSREVWKKAPGGTYHVRVTDPSERAKAYLQYFSDCDFGECSAQGDRLFPTYEITAKTLIPFKGKSVLRHNLVLSMFGCPSVSGVAVNCNDISAQYQGVFCDSLVYLSSEPEAVAIVYDLPKYENGSVFSSAFTDMRTVGPVSYGSSLYGTPLQGNDFVGNFNCVDLADGTGNFHWKAVFEKTTETYGIPRSALGFKSEIPGYPSSMLCDLYPKDDADEQGCYLSYTVNGEKYSIFDYLQERDGEYTNSGKIYYDGPGNDFAVRNDYYAADICSSSYIYARGLEVHCDTEGNQTATQALDYCVRRKLDELKAPARSVPGYFGADVSEICQ